MHFLKALFKANAEINVSGLWVKYSAPKFRISQCYTNSLKMNVFFNLSVGVAEVLSMG